MSNDRKASELLSKSFHGRLTGEEEEEIRKNVEGNVEAEKFAKISRLIQESVTDLAVAAESGDPSVSPGLSDAAKSRLKDSVVRAKRETASGTIDSDAMVSYSSLPGDTVTGDSRIARTRFTLLRKIGQGGLGAVWLARDEDLKRTVAVKEMLLEKADSPKHIRRFQREATITGLLEHPNVVPLYMYGTNSVTGKPFYAMRFLGKQTLADAIHEYHARRHAGQTEALDLHRLLTVFLDICQAIGYAHSRGVVHRDLKPENVALDNFGQVIVLDWGIAKLLSDGELAIQSSLNCDMAEDGVLTRTMEGEVVGTPLYMAPEQASGDLDSVDERTDVFGLGAILFAILAGCPPHERKSTEVGSDGISDLFKEIAECDPPSPSEFNANVSRDLEAICLRALSRKGFARHASAQELANDVERWMAGQHEKRKIYEAMRLETHGLRSHIASCIRDFDTNVRFMSTLPPIQGLIDAASEQNQEEETVWRERLATIFRGLLKSNSDFTSVAYSRVVDDTMQELVRVEKPTLESEVRSIPKSRLITGPLGKFVETVIQRKPDDVHLAINRYDNAPSTFTTVPMRLQSGVPVFDRDEEPFGVVVIEGDFDRLVHSELQLRNRASEQVLVIDGEGQVLLEDSERMQGAVGKTAPDLLPDWSAVKKELDLNGDYVDANRTIFATRVFLVPPFSAVYIIATTTQD